MRQRDQIAPFVLGLGLVACGDEGAAGEQYNGKFEYVCTREGDAACAGAAGPSGILPMDVALGAEFGARYTGDGPADAGDVSFAVKVVPASLTFVEVVSSERFVAKAAGHVALLGRGSNEIVADLIHVRIAPVGAIRLAAAGQEVTAIDVAAPMEIEAAPVDAEGRPLAGALVYTWTTSDASVVEVEPGEGTSIASVVPVAEGVATVTASLGDTEAALDVTVGVLP